MLPALATPVEAARRSKRDWYRALWPIALKECGDDAHKAGIVADYASTDMVLTGRTLLLPEDAIADLPTQSQRIRAGAEARVSDRRAAA